MNGKLNRLQTIVRTHASEMKRSGIEPLRFVRIKHAVAADYRANARERDEAERNRAPARIAGKRQGGGGLWKKRE